MAESFRINCGLEHRCMTCSLHSLPTVILLSSAIGVAGMALAQPVATRDSDPSRVSVVGRSPIRRAQPSTDVEAIAGSS